MAFSRQMGRLGSPAGPPGRDVGREGRLRPRLAVPAMRRGCVLAVLLLGLCGPGTRAAEPAPPPFAGMRLTAALDRLHQQGLRIVYSSALVTPAMVVASEPTAREPRAVLDEILAPHGLAVLQGRNEQLVVVPAAPRNAAAPTGSIRGRIETEGHERRLPGVTVNVRGTGLAVETGADGAFAFLAVPPGEYSLETESAAFRSCRVDGVRVKAGDVTRLRLRLAPVAPFLGELVVTPSHFKILGEEPESRQFLSREEVGRLPHVADDLFHAVKRLPGAAANDFSAAFNIRGGGADEILVLLDGLELIEPFHLKDFQSVFSTVDADAAGGVDFLTGGYPVEYGDRMSGVMDIAIHSPSGAAHTTVGAGTLNSRLATEGWFDDGRGQWLVTGRGWYPDFLLERSGAVSEPILTSYADVLGRVEHLVGDRSTLAADVLLAWDDLGFTSADADEVEDVRTHDRSHHLWLNLRTGWSDRLFSQTVLASGGQKRHRQGRVADVVEGTYDVDDRRDFEFLALKQDWTLAATARHYLKWGVELRQQAAEYDYRSRSVAIDPTGGSPPEVEEVGVQLAPAGESVGAYAADRIRIGDRLVAEVGLRWDRQSWLDADQLSPRVNVSFAAGAATTLRAAWGRFHQSQRLNELQVEDGESEFDPAQRSEHVLASLEHHFAGGLGARLEAYSKRFSRLRPRHENLFNPIELFPESRDDRVLVAPAGGRAQGVELLLKQEGGGRLTWWASYALARAEDDIDGEMVPRSWDQRHAASLGCGLRFGPGWSLNLAGTYHSGWPTTGVTGRVVGVVDEVPVVELELGARNRERLPPYWRLDLRATRSWSTSWGDISLVLEVINFTDRQNVCCVEDFTTVVGADGSVQVIPEEGTSTPFVPSLMLQWQF